MKTLNLLYLLVSGILMLNTSLLAQTPSFDVSLYQEFLEDNRDMTTSELLEMYPSPVYQNQAGITWSSAAYSDSIEIKYELTEHEKELVRKHGFMVTERLRKNSIPEQFLDIWHKDLPVFVSTDAILHAFHFYYVEMLQRIERGALVQLVEDLLTATHDHLPELATNYASYPEMEQMLKDVDVYLAVPRRLLGQNVSAYYPENEATINQLINLIEGEVPSNYPLFSEHCRTIDFSQFTPRGHYAGDAVLEKYFRTMMWLGRTEIYLSAPEGLSLGCDPQTFADVQRQAIDAVLLSELIQLAEARNIYENVETVLSFIVGEQDNATLPELENLLGILDLQDASVLLDSTNYVVFRDSLANQTFADQNILSQLLAHDPFAEGSAEPASAFLLFGQRFIIDSYILGNVVYDKITYDDEFICRLSPSTLDMLFALGNDPAAQLLQSDLDEYLYASNLAGLRYLVDSYDEDFWDGTIYSLWLNSIRSLNPPQEYNHLPKFMQTGAWWQQKMNTQLASWTELRHDHLLYAKPSYTAGITCSYPYGYVEPIPQVYANLNKLGQVAYEKFFTIPFEDQYFHDEILGYFTMLQEVTATLQSIAEKELSGTPFSTEETEFLQQIVFSQGEGCAVSIDGWYMYLLFGPNYEPSGVILEDPEFGVADYLVADYHTIPTDCGGNIMGWVKHAGTGPIDMAVVNATLPNNQQVAFVGPVMSFYEYTTTNFQRLTDQEWETEYLPDAERPNWTHVYLADEEGNPKVPGGEILTSVEEPTPTAKQRILAKNYPNPFRPPTTISYTIPHELSNSFVEVTIYDLQGKRIKQLINAKVPAGTYLTQWDGRNDASQLVAGGIYLYEIKCGNEKVIGKMTMIK